MVDILVNNVTGTSGGSPYQTIAQAIAAASAGDRILIVNTGVTYTTTFNNTTISGSVGNPITITNNDPTNPATHAPTNPYRFQGVDYWTIDGLVFDYGYGPGSDGSMLRLGVTDTPSTLCTNFIIQNCRFTHSTLVGLSLDIVDTVSVIGCHFLDIRRRVAGLDQGGLEMKDDADNVIIQYCIFEDCNDGIEIQEKQVGSVIGDVTIEYCEFFINRPYGVKTWHDPAFTNVGENGIDIKDHNNGDGVIIVRYCKFHGFRTITSADDASGANGEAVVLHNDTAALTTPVLLFNNLIYNCDQGINLNDNTGNGVGATIVNNVVFNCDDWVLNIIDGSNFGLVIEHNTFANSAGGFRIGGSAPGTTIDSMRNNIIFNVDGSLTRGTVTDTATDYNCWNGNTSSTPAAWVGANDVTSAPSLNGFLAPEAGSPVLNAGTNLTYDTDFIGRSRDATPAMGAYETEPTQAANVDVYDDFLQLYEGGIGTVTDPNSALWVSPRARLLDGSNPWGLGVSIDDTAGSYITYVHSTIRRRRVRFYVDPNNKTMANDDDFGLVSFLNGTSTAASVRLRYTDGDYRIVVRMAGDTATVFASTATGNIIGDEPTEVEVDLQWAASAGVNDGFIRLYIDGTLRASNAGIDNDTNSTDSLAYGPRGGIDAGTVAEEDWILLGPITANTDGAAIGTVTAIYENDSRLVSYWKFKQNALDTIATGNDLTEVNSPTYSANANAIGGYEAVLTRASSQYFSITDAAQTDLALTNAFTIVGRATMNSLTGTQYFVGKIDTSGDYNGYIIYTVVGTAIWVSINNPDGGNGYSAGGTISLATFDEFFWAAIFNGTSLALYVNGNLIGSATFATTTVDSTAQPFQLGARNGTNTLDGRLNYVAVFDAALTYNETEFIRQYGILPLGVPQKMMHYKRLAYG